MTDHPARGRATTTLPEMRRAGIAVCQATLLARAKPEIRRPEGHARLSLDYANQEIASATARGQLAYYELLERRGSLRMIRTVSDLDGTLGALERRRWGGTDRLTSWRWRGPTRSSSPARRSSGGTSGLRSVNLAHYGKSRYAVGTGDDGPLTPEGIQLLKEFEQLGMILDATHLSDTSFFQALDVFPARCSPATTTAGPWFRTAASSPTSRSVC